MAKKPAQAAPDPAKDPAGFTVLRLRAGGTRQTIVGELEAAGVDRVQATNVVHEVIQQIRAIQEKERITANAIVRGLVAGIVAAFVGGTLWALIVAVTDYEIGIMATGIGLLAGFATVRFAGAKGLPLQLIAVGAALLGIILGKYLTFFVIVRELVTEEYGTVVASQVMPFDPQLIEAFVAGLGEFASPYDLLWIVLAVVAAWRIPKALAFRLPEAA
jgi:hypothetical protein